MILVISFLILESALSWCYNKEDDYYLGGKMGGKNTTEDPVLEMAG